jgi:hypothetical protein
MTIAGNRGRMLFVALVLLIVIVAIFALNGSGSKGIEERFSSALGISSGDEEHGSGDTPGFSLEGNPLLYVIVLVLLGVACWIVYRKFGM